MKPTYTLIEVKQILIDLRISEERGFSLEKLLALNKVVLKEISLYSPAEQMEIGDAFAKFATYITKERIIKKIYKTSDKTTRTPTHTVVEVKKKLSGISLEDFTPLDKLLTAEWSLYTSDEQKEIEQAYIQLYLKHNPGTYKNLN